MTRSSLLSAQDRGEAVPWGPGGQSHNLCLSARGGALREQERKAERSGTDSRLVLGPWTLSLFGLLRYKEQGSTDQLEYSDLLGPPRNLVPRSIIFPASLNFMSSDDMTAFLKVTPRSHSKSPAPAFFTVGLAKISSFLLTRAEKHLIGHVSANGYWLPQRQVPIPLTTQLRPSS